MIPTLISPASGTTGVSTGPLDVSIGRANQARTLYLKDGNGTITFATNFRPANPPSDDLRTGTFAQLASQTTYQVYANVSPPDFGSFDSCANTPQNIPADIPELLGSFTTR